MKEKNKLVLGRDKLGRKRWLRTMQQKIGKDLNATSLPFNEDGEARSSKRTVLLGAGLGGAAGSRLGRSPAARAAGAVGGAVAGGALFRAGSKAAHAVDIANAGGKKGAQEMFPQLAKLRDKLAKEGDNSKIRVNKGEQNFGLNVDRREKEKGGPVRVSQTLEVANKAARGGYVSDNRSPSLPVPINHAAEKAEKARISSEAARDRIKAQLLEQASQKGKVGKMAAEALRTFDGKLGERLWDNRTHRPRNTNRRSYAGAPAPLGGGLVMGRDSKGRKRWLKRQNGQITGKEVKGSFRSGLAGAVVGASVGSGIGRALGRGAVAGGGGVVKNIAARTAGAIGAGIGAKYGAQAAKEVSRQRRGKRLEARGKAIRAFASGDLVMGRDRIGRKRMLRRKGSGGKDDRPALERFQDKHHYNKKERRISNAATLAGLGIGAGAGTIGGGVLGGRIGQFHGAVRANQTFQRHGWDGTQQVAAGLRDNWTNHLKGQVGRSREAGMELGARGGAALGVAAGAAGAAALAHQVVKARRAAKARRATKGKK